MGGNRRGRSVGLPIDDSVVSAPSLAVLPPPAAPPDPSLTASFSTTAPPGASVSTTTDSWSEVTAAGSPHSRRANDNITTIATSNNNNITDIAPPTTTTDPSSTTTHVAVNFSLHPDFDLSDDAGGDPPTLATIIYPLPLLGGMFILTPSTHGIICRTRSSPYPSQQYPSST